MKVVLLLCFFAVAAEGQLSEDLAHLAHAAAGLFGKRDENKIVTLKEYLDGLEEPHPHYRSLSARAKVDCKTTCAPEAVLDKTKECPSKQWVPEYKANGDCECLVNYRCCNQQKCPTPNKKACWANGKEGLLYGVVEVDCCGCQVVKCLECDAVVPRETACPSTYGKKCYNYNPKASKRPETHCFESHCERIPSDAPPDKECDNSCQRPAQATTSCGYSYGVCKPNRRVGSCPLRTKDANKPKNPPGLDCYLDPKQENDYKNGRYWNGARCTQCQKWTYTKKSCKERNTITAAYNCHQHGDKAFDKKCMKKIIVPDSCLCNDFICEKNTDAVEAPMKFLDGEVCPKNYVKKAGTSICGGARDICKRCENPLPRKSVEKTCKYGTVVDATDCNGCPMYKCEKVKYTGDPADCLGGIFVYMQETKEIKCKPQPKALRGKLIFRNEKGSGIDSLAAFKGEGGSGVKTSPGFRDLNTALDGAWVDNSFRQEWNQHFKTRPSKPGQPASQASKVQFMFWKRGTWNTEGNFVKGLFPVVNIIFDGRNSDSTNWFKRARVTEVVRGPNVKRNRSYNYWSAKGDSSSPNAKRHFFVNYLYRGCPNDVGVVAVIDGYDVCNWAYKGKNFPRFLYTGGQNGGYRWRTSLTKEADLFTISVY